jgi:ketosteroid isomerase-like protein
MSQENVELVHQAADAFNQRDLDAFLALCDPEMEFFSRILELEGGGPYRGHEGVRRWWEGLFDVSPDFITEIDEVRDLGDVTLARYRLRGHGTGSGASMEHTSWQVIEWRHRKAIWWRVFLSEAEALEAAGLSE